MDLNPKQQEAVNHQNGPILIAAGAGSGKTKTLTSRLLKLLDSGVPGRNIIAITFTNKAAREMEDRVTNNSQLTTKNTVVGHKLSVVSQPFIGTFHSLGARILKAEAKLLGRTAAFSIFDDDDSLSVIKRAIKELGLNAERYKPAVLASQTAKVKNLLLEPDEIFDQKSREVYDAYENALIRNNAFDFEDLIEKVVRLFGKHEAALHKYQQLFKYILVDEYQDVNTAQYEMVRLLAQSHRNLSVVGDDAQAIYGWRHADFRNFLNFEKDWPDAKIVTLEQNYRSSSTIITAASELIGHNKLQRPKNLWTENSGGEPISVVRAGGEEEEANFIVNSIKQMGRAGDGSNAVAILYRTNAQSRSIEQALIQYEIPYRIFGGVKFYERKEIKDLVAGLRLAMNPKDEISKERLLKTFTKQVGAKLVAELASSGAMPPLEAINFFLKTANYFAHLEQKFTNSAERVENVNEFIVFAAGFEKLDAFLEKVSLLQTTDAPADKLTTKNLKQKTPVSLMTIHMAKGLEFETVFVAGCSEGLLPHQMSLRSAEELEEERRLMYVAMTRARKSLYLTFTHIPSRFLYEIPPELTEFTNLAGDSDGLPDEEEMYID